MTNFFHNKRKSCTIKRKQQKALTDPTVHPPISLFPLPPFPSLYLSHSLSLCLRRRFYMRRVSSARRKRAPPAEQHTQYALFTCSLSLTHTHAWVLFFGFAIDHWTLVVKTRARPKFLHSLDSGCECVCICRCFVGVISVLSLLLLMSLSLRCFLSCDCDCCSSAIKRNRMSWLRWCVW